MDPRGKILDTNNEMTRLTSYSKEQLLGKSIFSLLPFTKLNFLEDCLNSTKSNKAGRHAGKMMTSTSSYLHVMITTVKTVHKKNGYLIIEDITDKKRYEDQVTFLAFHDELTSLPNKRVLTLLIEYLTKKATPFSIMILDFDRFKQVNDTYGRSFGDQVLMEISNRLIQLTGGASVVGRLAGDEFLVVFPEEDCGALAEKIIAGFQTPLKVKNIDITLTASGGIAVYPEHGHTSEALLKRADQGMYQIKRAGGNNYRIQINTRFS